MKKLKLVLDRIEGNYGVLITPDKKEVQVPKSLLSSKNKGDEFSLELKTAEEAEMDDQNLAKNILNEILNDK